MSFRLDVNLRVCLFSYRSWTEEESFLGSICLFRYMCFRIPYLQNISKKGFDRSDVLAQKRYWNKDDTSAGKFYDNGDKPFK